MLSGEPQITDHAYVRAKERLGITRHTFYQWTKATYRDWLQVSAKYLRDRGVTVDGSAHTEHFVCPWTPRQSLAIAMAPDGWMRTIVVFDLPFELGE